MVGFAHFTITLSSSFGRSFFFLKVAFKKATAKQRWCLRHCYSSATICSFLTNLRLVMYDSIRRALILRALLDLIGSMTSSSRCKSYVLTVILRITALIRCILHLIATSSLFDAAMHLTRALKAMLASQARLASPFSLVGRSPTVRNFIT